MPNFLLAGLLAVAMLLSMTVVLAESANDEVEKVTETKHALPTAQDLAALGEISRSSGVPILIMFSTESCVHCERLEEEVLRPMRLSGMDPGQVIVRKVMLDEYETLRLFSGKQQEADRYAYNDKGVYVVPTVALMDQDGNDLVPKIVGYNTPGFYENYLNEAIQHSGKLLKQRLEKVASN